MPDPIEREVEEILQKLDAYVPEAAKPSSRRGGPLASGRSWLASRLKSVSLNHVMMLCTLVVLVTFFARGVPWVGWIMLAAVVICLTALAFSFHRESNKKSGRNTGPEKRWRGQAIDLSTPSGIDRLPTWLHIHWPRNRH